MRHEVSMQPLHHAVVAPNKLKKHLQSPLPRAPRSTPSNTTSPPCAKTLISIFSGISTHLDKFYFTGQQQKQPPAAS